MTIFNDLDFAMKLVVLALVIAGLIITIGGGILIRRAVLKRRAARTPPIDWTPWHNLVTPVEGETLDNVITYAEMMRDFQLLSAIRDHQLMMLQMKDERIAELEAQLERVTRLKTRYWRRIRRMKLGVQA